MKGGLPMYDHRWKKVGVMLSAISLICMIGERLKGFIIIARFNVAQHYAMFEWLMLYGLVVVIFCREKHDDDRTQMVRRKAYQMGFYIMLCVLMAQAAVATEHPQMVIGADTLFFISSAGILFYLLFFHIGVYFDFLWDYDDRGVWENLRNIDKNKWSLVVYFIASAIILLLLSLMPLS